MIRQFQALLEVALGQAAVQVAARPVIGGLAAGDGEQVLAHLDRQFFGLEAGDRDVDAVGLIVGAFDIVGRIALSGLGGRGIELGRQAVEADGGAVQRGEIDGAHRSKVLLE